MHQTVGYLERGEYSPSLAPALRIARLPELFGAAGGFAGSGRGRAWGRRTCGVLAVLGSLVMLTVASDSVPLGTARGVWVGLLASSLVAVWCLACTVPWRIASPGLLDRPRHAGAVTAAVGALVGLAWACTLRSFLDVVAGGASEVTWAGTFGGVLLPGAVVTGAAVPGARAARPRDRRRAVRGGGRPRAVTTRRRARPDGP